MPRNLFSSISEQLANIRLLFSGKLLTLHFDKQVEIDLNNIEIEGYAADKKNLRSDRKKIEQDLRKAYDEKVKELV